MRLTLLRHPKPAISQDICYGRMDVPLESGFENTVERWKQCLHPPKAIVSSPLQRCRGPAEHLAQHFKCALHINEDVREMDFGRWEGVAWSDIPRPEIDAWAADFFKARPHGGENVSMLMDRTRRALAKLRNGADNQLVITHAGVIRCALAEDGQAETFQHTIEYGFGLSLV